MGDVCVPRLEEFSWKNLKIWNSKKISVHEDYNKIESQNL